MSNISQNKVIAIIGPTATGKTGLAVDLACKYNGEILSADSRQVYKGMDIGTGKDLDEYIVGKTKIPYHMIDLVSPNTDFNLAKYYKKGRQKLYEIEKRGRLPIIAGGTGLYVEALVDGFNLSDIKPDKNLRKKLEKKGKDKLIAELNKLKPGIANKLNNSDKNNPRRLIRYIEILKGGGDVFGGKDKSKRMEDVLIMGVYPGWEELKKRVYKRLIERLEKEGMVEEVEDLHKKKRVSWSRLEKFGLEYKYISLYLKGDLEYKQMVDELYTAICQFAKRQMTWFRRWEKRGRKIYWVKNKAEAKKLVKRFLK